MRFVTNFRAKNAFLGNEAQRERDITDYYIKMLTLYEELDVSSKDGWKCADDIACYQKKRKKEWMFEVLVGLTCYLDDVYSTDITYPMLEKYSAR